MFYFAGLSRTQISMWGFIVFTILQIQIFLFAPYVYDEIAPGLDIGPDFPFYRLIGVKEVGLMTVYIFGTCTNDSQVFISTVVLRSSVLIYSLYIVFGLGAPKHFLLGVIQDLSSSAWTLWELKNEGIQKHGLSRKNRSLIEILLRMVVFFCGLLEVRLAYSKFFYHDSEFDKSNGTPFIDKSGSHLNIGYLSFAYMCILVGLYQMYYAVVRVYDIIYIAIAFQNLSYYYLANNLGILLGNSVLDKNIHAPDFNLKFGLAILILSVLNYQELKERNLRQKSN